MAAVSNSSLSGRCLVFQLLDRTYAIPIGCVEEIVPMAELSPLPGSPSFISGFLNIGGQCLAVVSMRRLMGMPDCERQLYSPLVILKLRMQRIVLEVDTVSHIVDVADNELIPLSEGCSLNDCAMAIANIGGSSVVVLAPERILLKQEERRAAELAELARQRVAQMEEVCA
jgi:purine-binding chemotaxis protein CheW